MYEFAFVEVYRDKNTARKAAKYFMLRVTSRVKKEQ